MTLSWRGDVTDVLRV